MAPDSSIAIDCLGYTPIPVALLSCDEVPMVDLYRREADTGRLRLYRAANVPMLPEDLERLEKSKVGWLYSPNVDQGEMQLYIRRKLDMLVRDNNISVRDRFRKLNDVVEGILSSAFEMDDTDEVMRSSAYVASMAVRLLCQDELTAGDLISLLHHDFQAVTHSLNVAYMMVRLAREMRMVADDELTSVAVAGILHDIGKLSVSERILNKSQRLQRREERVAQKHPAHGFRRLCERTDISFGQLMVVYQHHERTSGKGYPVGAVGDEIHPWARLCSVVNVFESLVSNRPYRRRYPLTEAFQIMDGPLSKGLDQEIYRCWKHLILKK
ncbi:HD-GYP domain-containing protein [Blastopirellula marina]|uniref:Metal-dependent phosphohydrolase n=1 Tax=Blastopirellula marina TaxID=124 RepID=A0A2S8GM57_9BACT|nr:HD domain-containing phosphohydrolase [Blastopirellula marina]PQO45519.1 metal-dependent phosphohydrolase [Blastopirellula marina]